MAAGLELPHQPVGEERLQGGSEQRHDCPSREAPARSTWAWSRCAASAISSGDADRYQYVEAGPECPMTVDSHGSRAGTSALSRYFQPLQHVHRIGVPQPVDGRAAPPGPGPEPGRGHQAGESLVNGVVGKAVPGAGGQYRGRGPSGERLVTAVPVAGERGEGCRVERDQAEALRLVLADEQHAFDGVDVSVVERERLADPQPGHRQERYEDGIGVGSQRAPQPPGRGLQRGDVGGRVKVGHRPEPPAGEQARGRDLVGRVVGVQERGETADRFHAQCRGIRPVPRLAHPVRCRLDRERVLLPLAEVVQELPQVPLGPDELAAERPAQGQVVIEVAGERAGRRVHGAPAGSRGADGAAGQGGASGRRAATSTLAYSDVVRSSSCRRTWPISARGAPAACIAVAAK